MYDMRIAQHNVALLWAKVRQQAYAICQLKGLYWMRDRCDDEFIGSFDKTIIIPRSSGLVRAFTGRRRANFWRKSKWCELTHWPANYDESESVGFTSTVNARSPRRKNRTPAACVRWHSKMQD